MRGHWVSPPNTTPLLPNPQSHNHLLHYFLAQCVGERVVMETFAALVLHMRTFISISTMKLAPILNNKLCVSMCTVYKLSVEPDKLLLVESCVFAQVRISYCFSVRMVDLVSRSTFKLDEHLLNGNGIVANGGHIQTERLIVCMVCIFFIYIWRWVSRFPVVLVLDLWNEWTSLDATMIKGKGNYIDFDCIVYSNRVGFVAFSMVGSY